jgi:hypothetical protein
MPLTLRQAALPTPSFVLLAEMRRVPRLAFLNKGGVVINRFTITIYNN